VVPQLLVELGVRDARFHDSVGELLIHLENAVHPPEVEDHVASVDRHHPPVGDVLAGAEGPQRDAQGVRHPDAALRLRDRAGADHRGKARSAAP
jgi:hypothetical protein